MKKLLLTFGEETEEGYESRSPLNLPPFEEGQEPYVTEIKGVAVIEKIPDLISFIDHCWKLMILDAKAVFTSPHYASSNAWLSPLTCRAVSEGTLNFASKEWREQSKFTEAIVIANFEVTGQFAVEQEVMGRSIEAQQYQMRRFVNTIQSVIFTLTKKPR